jgi:hypothetical protein
MVNNSTLDITLAVNATLKGGDFKNTVHVSKDEKA